METFTVDDFVQVALKSLSYCGLNLIPKAAKNKKEKILHALKLFYFWFSIGNVCFTIVGMVIYVILNRENMDFVVSTLPNIVNAPFIIFKVLMINRHRNRINVIFKSLKDIFPVTNAEQRYVNVQKSFKHLKLFMRVYSGLMIIMFISLVISTLSSYFANGTMFLPMNIWMPFTYDHDIIYSLVCVWIGWNAFNVETLSFGVDSLLFALVIMVAMMYVALQKHSEEIGNNDTTEASIQASIKYFIQRHDKINTLSDHIEKTFSESFLYNFVQSSLLICFVAFELSSASELSVVMLFVSYLITACNQVFVICYLGQTLIDSSVGIATGVFNCAWYRIKDPKLKRAVLLLLLRSQKAQKLTAKKFRVVSLETFTSVTKYSYFIYK